MPQSKVVYCIKKGEIGSRSKETWTVDVNVSPKLEGRGGLKAIGVASSADMTGEGTFIHVIFLLVDWLIP